MFTELQKAQIRQYLGYPDPFKYKHPRLESMFLQGALSAEAESLCVLALQNLSTIEAFVLSRGLSTSGIKRVDVIEFFQGKSSHEIRSWGRMYVTRLSITLGVPKYSDVFGNSGYLGDKLGVGGGLGPPYSGNFFPLG
jgi:hypothetical protein